MIPAQRLFHRQRRLMLLLCIVPFIGEVLATEDQPSAPQNSRLKNNPFVVPLMESLQTQAPSGSATELAEALELRAILTSPLRPMANINGQVMAVGEEIEGYVLQQIEETHVVLVKAGKESILSMDKTDLTMSPSQ